MSHYRVIGHWSKRPVMNHNEKRYDESVLCLIEGSLKSIEP
jgi:hypothetical protein